MNTPAESANRSTMVEQRLDDYGISPRITTIAVDSIDQDKSTQLQNRGRTVIDLDHVQSMAIHLDVDADRVLPRIVVAHYRNRLAVVDGNHRLAAYRMAGRTEVDAYVIDDAAAATVEAMAMEANAAGSKSLDPDERLTLALDYAELTGDLGMAARRFGYPHETLQKKRRARQGQLKAENAARVRVALPAAKSEALNRLDEDQISTLGRDLIENAPTADIAQAVANVVAVPASERALQVQQEVGRLAQIVKSKKTPAAKAKAKAAGPTIKQAISQLNRITAQLAANPSWRTDPALVAALSAAIAGVDNNAKRNHAA